MICHTFSVVSISTTSTNMTAAAVIMHPATADAVGLCSCHLTLVRSDSSCGGRLYLLLASLLGCVVVASH